MNGTGTSATDQIDVRVTKIPELSRLEGQWSGLEAVARPSFFLSWGWIGTWLRWMPDSMAPELLLATRNSETVGLAILVKSKQSRKGLVSASRTLSVNETGDLDYDLLTIEYNGMLIDPRYAVETAKSCLAYLDKQEQDWDEIIVRAADSRNPLIDPVLFDQGKLRLKTIRELPSWFVDLGEIRATGKPYLESLSSNTRYQIRRAIRECEKVGDIDFTCAQTTQEALEYLSGLIELHQAYWTGKGQSGCFSNSLFLEFHQQLVRSRFDLGEIQLVRLKLGTHALGYLYSLVSDGQVNFYQCGFNYQLGSKLKPGLVAHYKTIEYNLANDYSIYNFLASDDRYKRSLSSGKHELLWGSIQKRRLKFRLENAYNGAVIKCKNVVRRGRSLRRSEG